MIRKLLIAAATAAFGIAIAHGASAADLQMPVKAPPPAPPPFSWTGLYIGAHGGAGWGTTDVDANIGGLIAGLGIPGVPGIAFSLPVTSHNTNGWLAGGQIGYNWQSDRIVFGIEGDISWTNLEGTSDCLIIFECKTQFNWMADFTGRLGFVPIDRLLVYAKGGVAFANVDYSFGNSIAIGASGGTPGGAASASGSVNDTLIGGLFGFGAEYAFWPNWSAKIEYNFMDFGKADYNLPITASASGFGLAAPVSITVNAPISITQMVHVMKFGVNYRFQ